MMESQDMSSGDCGNKHWIFLLWGQDSFQLCFLRMNLIFWWEVGTFPDMSVMTKNRLFWWEVRTILILVYLDKTKYFWQEFGTFSCLWWWKSDIFDGKLRQFRVVLMAMKSLHFWWEVRTFPVTSVATKNRFLWWEVRTVSSHVCGDENLIFLMGNFPFNTISSCVNGNKDFWMESWDISSCGCGEGTRIFQDISNHIFSVITWCFPDPNQDFFLPKHDRNPLFCHEENGASQW